MLLTSRSPMIFFQRQIRQWGYFNVQMTAILQPIIIFKVKTFFSHPILTFGMFYVRRHLCPLLPNIKNKLMKKMRFEIRILMKSFIDFLSRVLHRFKTLNTHLSIMNNMTKHMFNKSTCRVNMLNNLFNLTESKSSTSRLRTVEISLLTIFFALILTLLISKQASKQ